MSPPEADLLSPVLSARERAALGPLASLLHNGRVRDVLVQRRGGVTEVWVDEGSGVHLAGEIAFSPQQLREFAAGLIACGGRHLDDLTPSANVRIGDGVRVHALIAPIVHEGAAVSIRVPRAQSFTFDDLVARGLCAEACEAQLRWSLTERHNMLISGATASGKTTLLAALLGEVPHSERIISIEDVAELTTTHPHHLALQTRQANSEGAGAMTAEALLTEVLRMRPDRVVLGECRGEEIATLMRALNTGHDGGMGTIHASSLADVPARLEALGVLAGLSPSALTRQAASAFDLLVHLERQQGGAHRIVELGRLTRTAQDTLTVESLWRG